MKIQYISDLHLEFQWDVADKFKVSPEADVLVLAGDIHTQFTGISKFFKKLRKQTNIPVVFVPGNHEFYGHEIDKAVGTYKAIAEDQNIHFLNSNGVKINDVQFIGSTLYSNLSNPLEAMKVKNSLNDFRVVSISKDRSLDIETWNYMHEDALETIVLYLTLCRQMNTKIVIATHFAPLFQLNKSHQNSPANAGFYSNLEWLFNKYEINAWIYGHTHDPVEMEVNGCKIVSNQLGYPYEGWLKLKTKIVEI